MALVRASGRPVPAPASPGGRVRRAVEIVGMKPRPPDVPPDPPTPTPMPLAAPAGRDPAAGPGPGSGSGTGTGTDPGPPVSREEFDALFAAVRTWGRWDPADRGAWNRVTPDRV